MNKIQIFHKNRNIVRNLFFKNLPKNFNTKSLATENKKTLMCLTRIRNWTLNWIMIFNFASAAAEVVVVVDDKNNNNRD